MRKIFLAILGTLLYMEAIYHLAGFGLGLVNPMLMLPAAITIAAMETILVTLFRKKKKNQIVFWILMGINYLMYAVHLVYLHIFKLPLRLAVAVTTGGDALSEYWREALVGVGQNIGYLFLMLLPLAGMFYLTRKRILKLKALRKQKRIEAGLYAVAGISVSIFLLLAGYVANLGFYEEYQAMYAPNEVAKKYGMLPIVERDILGKILKEKEISMDAWANMGTNSQIVDGTEDLSTTEAETETDISIIPNVFSIRAEDIVAQSENNENIAKLAAFMETMTPTNKNEYTGMFEGYNLILITAEGFSHYAVSEEITPTLYKLVNNGLIVDDYYVPLWQTSTSDGEYVNMTGQIPDEQNSMKRSADKEQPYSLAKYFAKEGVTARAYHNNSLSYYDRHLTHPNMGYVFKATKLGSLPESKYGSWILPMENAKAWPASDYDMMVASIPEYINDERFFTYYMTVSGHMVYDFTGNSQSIKNKDVVANLDCSEEMKAYIACNYELEKAMTYLLEELEKAGKLEKTVIVLSTDHYPYGLETSVLEEFSGKKLEDSLELYRNSLIFWNSEMENIVVEKTCCAADIYPTILNLFGFEFDSRLFAGRDMLSDASPLVVFSDRSFITDKVIYNKSEGTAVSRTSEEVSEDYMDMMKAYVRGLVNYSAGVLNDNFHKYVNDWMEVNGSKELEIQASETVTEDDTETTSKKEESE